MGIEVIEECHRQWYNLMLAASDKDELNLLSVTHKHLVAQGLTSSAQKIELPKIEYPRYEEWQARPMQKFAEVDGLYEEYEIDEDAPDQRRPRKS